MTEIFKAIETMFDLEHTPRVHCAHRASEAKGGQYDFAGPR